MTTLFCCVISRYSREENILASVMLTFGKRVLNQKFIAKITENGTPLWRSHFPLENCRITASSSGGDLSAKTGKLGQ